MQDRVNKFFKELGLLEELPTASAFCQAREKIKPVFFKELNKETGNFFYENYEQKGLIKRWKGHLLWATDCSYFNLPDEEETRENYSIQVGPYNTDGQVKAMGSFLYDVTNEVVVDCKLDKIQAEKSFIFDNHSKCHRPGVINIYDRGYADYSVIALHVKEGKDFIIRSPLSNTFKAVEEFIKSNRVDEIITLKVTNNQKKFIEDKKLPKEVRVRLVKVTLDNGEIEVLISSLLNQAVYILEDFKWVYNERWGIETHLDRLKNRLEIEKFSSEKPIGIEQDFYGIVFLSTLESVLSKENEQEVMEESKDRDRIFNYKINKSISYSTLVDYTVDLFLNLEKSPSEVVRELRILFKTGIIPERPGRHFERKKITPTQKLRFYKYSKRVWA